MAPLVQSFFDLSERYLDIDIGVFDYVLRCIDGPYLGKTLYINSSPNGEIIGGEPGYNQQRNQEKLTLYIENSDLQKRHAQITLNHHCQYWINDLTDHKLPNAGIWIKVPTYGDGIDLYKDQNWKRKFRIGKDGH